jgi:hypothetical protein
MGEFADLLRIIQHDVGLESDTHKRLISRKFIGLAVMLALLAVTTPAHAEWTGGGNTTGTMFYASCMAAADIMEGRPPPSDPDVAVNALNNAAMCLGAVTAIANLEAFLKPEFAMCPPEGSTISYAQMILVVAAYLRNHPEQLHKNFHGLAVVALATAWPCSRDAPK